MGQVIDISDVLMFNRRVEEQRKRLQQKLETIYQQDSFLQLQLKYIKDLHIIADTNWQNMMYHYELLKHEERAYARVRAWRKAKRCRDEYYGHQVLIQRAIRILHEVG